MGSEYQVLVARLIYSWNRSNLTVLVADLGYRKDTSTIVLKEKKQERGRGIEPRWEE